MSHFLAPDQSKSAYRQRQSFSWLHLSDLHFKLSDRDSGRVLDSLLEDLKSQMESAKSSPDVVFVTGDIAYSGRAAEYELAERFFSKLLDTLDLPTERLLLVPGNHDVDWGRIGQGSRSIGHSLIDHEAVAAVLENDAERQILLDRLEGYYEHVERCGAIGRKTAHLGYQTELRIGTWRIAVLGLNSAWLCEAGDDRARGLLLGEPQVEKLLRTSADADLRIALVHHPFDYLREFDRNECEALLTRDCDFILHGHLHRPAVQSLQSPDAGAVIIAGGAAWEKRTSVNAYNLVTIDLEDGFGEMQLRKYSNWSGGFWTTDTERYRNAPEGYLSFRFRPPENDSGNGREPRGFPDELKWYNLVRHIKRYKCTPIIGPGLTESLLGSRRAIARAWASLHDYPLGPVEQVDLPQVTQYLAAQENERFMRDELADFLRDKLAERYGSSLKDSPESLSLDDLVCRIGEHELSASFDTLASLPFPVLVTADASSLLQRALERAGKQPRVELCPWSQKPHECETVLDREPDYQPTPEEPLIYHLFGRLDEPGSMVLTEDNYFDFLIHISNSATTIPGAVKRPLSETALLFLGFELHAWDFRVLFRSLVRQEGDSQRDQFPHVAVQLEPGLNVADQDRARHYLEHYFRKSAAISIYWGEVATFVQQLGARWQVDR